MPSPLSWSSNFQSPWQNQQTNSFPGQQQMSSIFGPATMQNFMNRMPRQNPNQQGAAAGGQFGQWMQQTPMAYGQGQQNPMSQMFGSVQGAPNVRAGDFLSEAFMRDYFNHANARNQASNLVGGFLSNMQNVPQMGMAGVNMAIQNGQQGMDIAREAMRGMQEQSSLAQRQASRTRNQVSATMGSARQDMEDGISTMRGAIAKRENEGIGDISGGLAGIQGQFNSERQRINSDPSMTDEERQVALDNLNNTMRQQSSMYAGQAQRQIDDSLAAMRTSLSGMQANMGSTLGALGMQGAGINASTGMQAAGMGMQAAQFGYELMSNQSRFAGGLAQQAMAQAMDAMIRGNALGAEMAMNMPLGMPNIADTILAMMQSQGMRAGHTVNQGMSGRLGGLIGNTQFRGYGNA